MKKLLALAMISTCAVGGWRVLRGGGDEASAPHEDKLVADRVWLDHLPANDRDTISAFVVLSDEAMGGFQSMSQWKGQFEVFRFEAHGHELRLNFPQTGEREQVKAITSKCGERGFDYCLELSGSSRGVARYYSRKGWEIEGATRPDELRGRVEALVRAGSK